MTQTHEGAIKALAKLRGMTVKELMGKLQTHSFCYKCKQWLPIDQFGVDRTRFNGLHRQCFNCRRTPEDKKVNLKGRVSVFKGRKHTPEARRKIGLTSKGNQRRKGKYHTAETKKKISERTRQLTPRGVEHPNWKGGVSSLHDQIRQSSAYSDWRSTVFERDNYTCQHCGDNAGGNLQAHHIKPFAQYPELRFELSNGITLCETCHLEMHSRPLTTEDIELIRLSYQYALDMFGSRTNLAKAWNIDVRTLNKIINRTHRFKESQ